MSGEELGSLFAEGIISGILMGFKLMLPYIIGFCAICVIIRLIKNFLRKMKKKNEKDKAPRS